ncbi:MAG: DUF5706 domain-containing protein [Bacteroidales bacterium]|nr:DUF5706 domain-containing protein [Bacteroidales bacterium]MCF8333343.1 DUF5706 domain-containing protein [Bacteroidales bacterium]
MNDKDKIDFAWKILINNQDMVKFADSKIKFLLVISGISTTYVLTNFNSLLLIGLPAQILIGVFLIAFLLFIVFALLTIYPRYASNTDMSVPKLIYHHHVSQRNKALEYRTDFKETEENEFLDDVLYQVYEVSKIADKKFRYYNKSGIFIGIQLVAFVVICVFKIL